MKIPPDFVCHGCHARPIAHVDLCDVCEGDAQRSDRLQLEATIAPPKFSDAWMDWFHRRAA